MMVDSTQRAEQEMTAGSTVPIFIGWDVGSWNCDKNPASRDGLVVLDEQRRILGAPWLGNVRRVINQAIDSVDFIVRLLALCGLEDHECVQAPVVLTIDAPQGFSVALRELFAGKPSGPIGNSSSNPYLFRYTERFLFEMWLSPLSAIKDMIGSQATKGMHVLARFAPEIERCGVWTDGQRLSAIEAYPAACKRLPAMDALYAASDAVADPDLGHADLDDALTCALIAWFFYYQPEQLVQPDPGVDLG